MCCRSLVRFYLLSIDFLVLLLLELFKPVPSLNITQALVGSGAAESRIEYKMNLGIQDLGSEGIT